MASTQAWIQTTVYTAPSLYPPEQQAEEEERAVSV